MGTIKKIKLIVTDFIRHAMALMVEEKKMLKS